MQRLNCYLTEVKLDAGEDEGTFEGYGSVFNNVDGGGDVVAPGAFKKTLKEWGKLGKLPKMLLQHGGFLGPAEDGIPIGKYTEMHEDDHGLYVKGRLFALDTQKGRYIHEGLRTGELDGLSIGYQAVDVSYGKTPDEPRRTLKGVKLFEVSVVTFAMNTEARVSAAKVSEIVNSLADAEDYLRDACGFSRSQAVAFVSRVKALGQSDSDRGEAELLSELQQFRKRITT